MVSANNERANLSIMSAEDDKYCDIFLGTLMLQSCHELLSLIFCFLKKQQNLKMSSAANTCTFRLNP